MTKKYQSPIIIGVILLIIGFLSNAIDLYHSVFFIDKVYHFLAGAILGWFFYIYLFSENKSLSKLKQLLIIASVVCFFGVIWEFAERLSTLYSPEYAPWLYNWFRGGDLNDTLLDLLADMAGGCAAFFVNLSSNSKS